MTLRQNLASRLAVLRRFAAKSERDVLLAITTAVFILPFTVANFVQGRLLIGAVTTALVAWFVVHGMAVYRGRRLAPAAVVFLPALGVLAFALAARSELAIFWAYPALLLFHSILERRFANLFNVSVVLMTVPFAYVTFGAETALRVAATLGLTIVFANVFSYLIERQQLKAAEHERSLGEQAKFATDVFDSIAIGLSMRDPDGRYLFVNRAWETFTGARREDVIGKTVYDRAPKPEADAMVAGDRAALARGPGAAPLLQDFVHRGRRFILTRTVMSNAYGATRGVLVASVDMTERLAMEQALATEQRRFELVVRAARTGIVDWDGRTHATYYSPRFREILGHAADADTSGWPDYFQGLIHPEDRPRVTARFREYILGTGPEGPLEYYDPEEYRLLRADGSYLWVQSMGVCVRDETGFVTRFIAAITDITERRAQDEAMRASVRLREEVERMSHHDLKTPLNSIIAVPRLLREGRNLSSEEHELLSLVERAGYRILNLVNLSLDLFRMEQGSYSFRPQAVELGELARKVIADLSSQADSKQVELRMRTKDPAVARGEELLCYSMLANLLKNAIEASPEGGVVTVTVEAGMGALVHIHNAGAVPEAVRASFFEKYSTTGKPGGLGLGTYSALLMARVQEGNITMRTSAEEGTTLTVTLAEAPAGAAPAAPGAPQAGDRMPARMPLLAPLHVLVVDDDEFNRLVMRRYLPSPPLHVDMAVNGRAALEALRQRRYDFVFLDLEMPVMSGYEAAERIRKLEREDARQPSVLVAFSQNDDDPSIRRALAAGCDHYLIKPAPRETLWKLLAGGEVPLEKDTGKEAAFDDPVEIDVDLRPTLPAFFLSRRKVLDQIDAALGAGEPGAAKALAHTLGGSFALYGFRWARQQCRLVERAAAQGQAGEGAQALALLRRHLEGAELRFIEGVTPGP